MKRTIKLLAIAAVLAIFAVPAWAQSKECTPENKAAWYATFLKNRKGDEGGPAQQKLAYDAAKDYLKCGEDAADTIVQYLKKWLDQYEAITAVINNKLKLQDFYNKKNYAEAVSVGKQVVQNEPDFVTGHILIALSGYNATTTGNTSLLPDAEVAAKKALEMVETGKPFAPMASKDSAIGWLNFVIAKAKLKNSPEDAITNFLKAARMDNDLKKLANLYLELAAAYESGPRARLTDAYKPFVGQTETPEGKLILENLNQVIDRQIDALARAAALTNEPTDKKTVMDELSALYQYRNKSVTGLNELVAGVLMKPVPDVPVPLTSLPTPAPGTPATNGTQPGTPGTPVNNQPASGTPTKPAGNPATTTGTQSGSAAKPTPTPPAKPKPRRANHRRP